MQVIVVAILFALLGVVLGLMSPLTIPITYARYTAVGLTYLATSWASIFPSRPSSLSESGSSIIWERFAGIICKHRYHLGTQVLAPTAR